MWTLHRLAARKRSREEVKIREDSPCSPLPQPSPLDHSNTKSPVPSAVHDHTVPWGFSQEDLERFPALRRRNFWCIQRHQARALHYDLRMQLDGKTFSWAVPLGLLGLSKDDKRAHVAIETTLHEIGYTVFEGADGRNNPAGQACGTLLWDIGYYTISHGSSALYSDSEDEHKRKRRKKTDVLGDLDSEDPDGRHEEDKFRSALTRPLKYGKARTIQFTLRGGYKMTNHSYVMSFGRDVRRFATYSSDGREKKHWLLTLPKGVSGYSWGDGGEEGAEYGWSVKTSRWSHAHRSLHFGVERKSRITGIVAIKGTDDSNSPLMRTPERHHKNEAIIIQHSRPPELRPSHAWWSA